MTKTIRWITYGALFLIPFLPLVVANSFFFPFITGKNFAFRILVEVAVAGWALLMLVDAKYRPRFSWTAALFGIFVIWMAIADALAVNPAKAFWSNFERMDGWVTLIHVFALFMVAACVLGADKLWRKWWLTFLGVAAVVCLYSFGQVAGILQIHQGNTRVDATFGNSAYLAAYLLFVIAAALWIAFETRTKWLKYLLYVLTVASVIVLFYTETRGAILGFVGAVVLGAILWMIEAGKNGRRIAAAVIGVIIVLTLLFFGLRHSSFVQHIPGLDRVASISLNDSETTTRLVIWHMAYEGFLQKPIHGWGQEGFNYVFNSYYQPSLYAQEPWFDRAHDVFLDWLVAGGAPALILFLALLITAVVALYRNTNVSRTERIMWISLLAAYCFQGLFVFDNLFTYVPIAIILAMVYDASGQPISVLSGQRWQELSEENFSIAAVPVAAVMLLLVIWFVNGPGIRAASDIIVAITPGQTPTQVITEFKQAYADGSFANQEITEQLMTYATSIVGDPTVSVSDKEAVFTYALTQMGTLVTKIPSDARIRLEYALGFRAIGDYKDALTQSQAALSLSPKKQSIMIEEGLEQWQSGDVADAKVTFNNAYQLDTSFTDVAVYAAVGDIVDGEVPTGKALLQQAFGTTTVAQTPLIAAYYSIKDYPDFIALLKQQVINNGNDANDEFELAEAYSNAGDYAQARAEIQEAITEHPDAAAQGTQILSQIPTGN